MLTHRSGVWAALIVLVATIALIASDLLDHGVQTWWDRHAFTTDWVAGILVLGITVLVVDQVVGLRQGSVRSKSVAAQAAIVLGQAARASKSVAGFLDGSVERDAASDDVRTYMMMLLVAAPILIEREQPRLFLEQAQRLGGVFAVSLSGPNGPLGNTGRFGGSIDDTFAELRSLLTPLLGALSLDQQAAAEGGGDVTSP